MYNQFLPVGILFFACVHIGNTLRCYDCLDTNVEGSDMDNPDCEDPFQNNSKITTCPKDKPYCGKFKVDMIASRVTLRGCETADGCEGTEWRYCSLCSTDLCNWH